MKREDELVEDAQEICQETLIKIFRYLEIDIKRIGVLKTGYTRSQSIVP